MHRIGRTARAGKSGIAFSLLAPEDHDQLRDIEKTINTVIVCEDLPGFHYRDHRIVPDPERPAVAVRVQGQAKKRPTAGSGQRAQRRGGAGRAGGNGGNGGNGSGGNSVGGHSGGHTGGSGHSGTGRSGTGRGGNR